VGAHFVCDFVFQSDRMAQEKLPGADATLNWRWWLVAHAATHGLAETLLHAIIDWLKGRWRFSLGLDQALHLLCKLIWVGLLVRF
jgi:Protein of unknown function (DUF3307).